MINLKWIISVSKLNISDILISLVVISSIALRNFGELLYLFQILLCLICGFKLLKKTNRMYVLLYGSFVSLCFISSFWAVSIEAVIKVMPSIVQIFVICTLMYGYCNNIDNIIKIIHMITLSSVVLIINLLLSTTPHEWMYIWYYSSGSIVDVSSSAGRLGASVSMHPNEFASVIVICSLCSVFLYQKTKSKKYLFLSVVPAFFLMLSKSRGSILEMIIGLFSMYVFNSKKKLQLIYKFLMITVISTVIVFLLYNNKFFYSLIGYRMEGLFSLFSNSMEADASTTTRLEFILIGLELFLKNPLLGIGMNNYSIVSFSEYATWAKVYSHCNYVEILSNLGIIGFFLYYFLFFKSILILNKSTIYCFSNIYVSDYTIFMKTLSIVLMLMEISHITYNNECIQYITVVLISYVRFITNRKMVR